MSRFQAQLDGFDLDLETVEDSFENSVVEHEFPFQDGAKLEHMGQRARRITFRVYFLGDSYPTHENFLAHCGVDRLNEFIHPEYGTIWGRIKSASIHKSDLISAAEIDVSFVEEIQQDREPEFRPRPLARTTVAFGSGQAQLMTAYSDSLRTTFGARAAEILSFELDFDIPIVDQIAGASWFVRTLAKSIDGVLGQFESAATSISNPATSLITAVKWGSSIPGKVMSTVAKTIERYSLAAQSVASTPQAFLSSFKDGLTAIKAAIEDTAFHPIIDAQASLFGATVVAGYYEIDQGNRERAKALDGMPAFDVHGNYVRSEPQPLVLTVNDLEYSLASMREIIQSAMDSYREVTALRDCAEALLQHAKVVKLDRERIVTIDVSGPIPLHALCLQRGLPYTYADRIMAINPQIKNPSFVDGLVRVYVR